jgi:hypothetical protein
MRNQATGAPVAPVVGEYADDGQSGYNDDGLEFEDYDGVDPSGLPADPKATAADAASGEGWKKQLEGVLIKLLFVGAAAVVGWFLWKKFKEWQQATVETVRSEVQAQQQQEQAHAAQEQARQWALEQQRQYEAQMQQAQAQQAQQAQQQQIPFQPPQPADQNGQYQPTG